MKLVPATPCKFCSWLYAYQYVSNFFLGFVRSSGYLAPEYVIGGQLTLKADVYSFGIVTIEVVSGRSSANTNYGGAQKLLVEWVGKYIKISLISVVDISIIRVSE